MTEFDGIARLLANGEAPWLVQGLEHFSKFIGANIEPDERKYEAELKRMQNAMETLLRLFPLFFHLPLGRCPRDVELVLDALPRIQRALARANSVRRGPNVRRKYCAAVILEASRMVRGKTQPRSDQTYLACKAYWKACGNPPAGETDDIGNWERPVKYAMGENPAWIRAILERYR